MSPTAREPCGKTHSSLLSSPLCHCEHARHFHLCWPHCVPTLLQLTAVLVSFLERLTPWLSSKFSFGVTSCLPGELPLTLPRSVNLRAFIDRKKSLFHLFWRHTYTYHSRQLGHSPVAQSRPEMGQAKIRNMELCVNGRDPNP